MQNAQCTIKKSIKIITNMEKKDKKRKYPNSKMSKLLAYLETGQRVNKEIALEEFQIMDLAGVIIRLRREGYKIHIRRNFRTGRKHLYEYYMDESQPYVPIYNHHGLDPNRKRKKQFFSLDYPDAKKLVDYFNCHDSITSLEAFEKLGIACFRQILPLLKSFGYKFKTERMPYDNRGHYYNVYTLIEKPAF